MKRRITQRLIRIQAICVFYLKRTCIKMYSMRRVKGALSLVPDYLQFEENTRLPGLTIKKDTGD